MDRQHAAAAGRALKDGRVEVGRESTASVDYWYMSMNYARKPFDNLKVRQAIATAVDRDAVTKAAKFGRRPANQTAIPKGSFYYYDYKPFTHDADKARQLLGRRGRARRRRHGADGHRRVPGDRSPPRR